MIARVIVALCAALPVVALAFSSTSSGNATTYTGFNATASNVGRYAVSTASDGTVLVNSGGRLTVGGGGSIPINVQGSIPRANAAAAVGRFLVKGSGVVGVLGLGVAAYDLAQELGFTLSNSGADVVVSQPDPTAYQSGGSYWRAQNEVTRFAWTPQKACQLTISAGGGTYTGYLPAESRCTGTRGGFAYGASVSAAASPGYACASGQWHVPGATSCTPTQAVAPSTAGALADAIAAKSGWPTSSKLAETTKQAVAAGDTLAVSAPVVTGPATAPVSTTTSVDPATGNTTTTVVTISNTYSGPTVTTTTTTTSTVTNTSTGAPVGQPTVSTVSGPVTASAPEAEPAPFTLPCGIAGTPPCAVKVDETGTPTTVAELTDPQTRGEEVTAPIDPVVSNPQGFWPSLPTLSWAFSLPSGCSVISLPAFSPWLPAVDVCEFQPMFHDLMTVVWSVGALLGLVSLFWRNVFAGVPA